MADEEMINNNDTVERNLLTQFATNSCYIMAD
jgi:hypothetical protein